jgi:hypothetical protein
MIVTNQLYKAHSFYNMVKILSEVDPYAETSTVGAHLNDGIRVNERNELVKTPWACDFFSNGYITREAVFGEERLSQFKTLLNTKVKDFNLKDNQVGAIGKIGYQMNNFMRATVHNNITGEQGWYNIPDNATIADISFATGDYSITTKRYWDVPSQSKIEALQTAGIIDQDYTIHGVFPKVKFTLPTIRKYYPNNGLGGEICCTFAYNRSTTKDYNAYKDWHSIAWVKRPDVELTINRRGNGRNYIMPLTDINVRTLEGRAVPLSAGRPAALESERLIVRKEDSGYIIHLHEINT